MKQRIFISSVQKELATERQALKSFILGDALLSRFFDVFLFEDLPASDCRTDEVYLQEVERCDIYLALFGTEYGWEDADGYSPTHREFFYATKLGRTRLIFVKNAADNDKNPKMKALIAEAGAQLIRRRFVTLPDLVGSVYASLVDYLAAKGLLRSGPFDAAVCPEAALTDLSSEKITRFVGVARRARGFPLEENAPALDVLTHLNLLSKGAPTHAAVLLFGTAPQRFLLSSEVKCAHFHGTQVCKPIPSYQVYKGTLFDLVDQAVDFVLSKINLAVGTRELSAQAPVAYEIPPEVIREAIVNAVAHRDYTSKGSIQVMLFSDRLEIWNPGSLPHALSLEKLRHPHGSFPANPLLAEPLYLTKYIERMGTGTGDMIVRCREAGLPEPEFALSDGFVTTIRRKADVAFGIVGGSISPSTEQLTEQATEQVTEQVNRLVSALSLTPLSAKALMKLLRLQHRPTFIYTYLRPALEVKLVESTEPDSPTSPTQKYRLTAKGHAAQEAMKKKR